MKYYYYLYYRIYKFLTRIGKFETHYVAQHNVSIMEMFFIMSSYIILEKQNIVPKIGLIPLLIVIVMFMVFNHFAFMYKKRYLGIIKMFENETKRQKRISSIIVMFIFVFNLVFFIYAITSY